MRIRRIDLYLNRQPFRLAFTSLHADRREASGVLLRLESDAGPVGWGESTPREYVSGETCEGVLNLIETDLAPRLLSASLESTAHLQRLLDSLAAHTQRLAPVAATSALGAVDVALWDLWGWACHRPIHTFFVPEPLPLPPQSLSVPILPPKQLRRLYPLAAEMGLHRFKLVLSADGEENTIRLATLRELAGSRATITVDANGKLTPNQVLGMLPALRPFGITALEQPAPKADLDGLRYLRQLTDLPITVDESVCTLAEAQRVIDAGACDRINLKVSKCGGLQATQKIQRLARRHGLACQLGSHVGETPILAAAGRTAAQLLPDLDFMEIGSSVLDPCPALRPPGRPEAASPPGLGLRIDTGAVEAQFGAPVRTLQRSP
jgi:muconate cycloisomerase